MKKMTDKDIQNLINGVDGHYTSKNPNEEVLINPDQEVPKANRFKRKPKIKE